MRGERIIRDTNRVYRDSDRSQGYKRESRKIGANVTEIKLFERLNAPSPSSSARRITRLIELIQEADWLRGEIFAQSRDWYVDNLTYAMEREAGIRERDERWKRMPEGAIKRYISKRGKKWFAPGAVFSDATLQAINERYRIALVEINSLLSRYKWTPVVRDFDYWFMEHVWEFNVPKEHSTNLRSNDELWENVVVDWLFADTKFREIHRYGRCKQCRKWFYAMTDSQSYCSSACRKRFSARDDRFKEKRRMYMAEYRRREKQRSQYRAAYQLPTPNGRA